MNVLVTGGSRGLGFAVVESRLARGNNVCAAARSFGEEARALAEQSGGRLTLLEADLSITAASDILEGAELLLQGPLDSLILNAALPQDQLLALTDEETIQQIVHVNLIQNIALSRAAARRFIRRKAGVDGNAPGAIVVVSSVAAASGYAGLSVYGACKAGLESFVRSLARELRGRVLCNVVRPGFFESQMTAAIPDQMLERIVDRAPGGRLASIEDISHAVDLLLDQAGSMNGSIITVDAGATV